MLTSDTNIKDTGAYKEDSKYTPYRSFTDHNPTDQRWFSNKKFKISLIISIIFLILGLGLFAFTYTMPRGTPAHHPVPSPNPSKAPVTPRVTPTPGNPPLYRGPKDIDLTGKTIQDKYGNIYTVLNEFQRDNQYFTEGLSYAGPGRLVESSGYWNSASIHYLDIDRQNKTINKSKKNQFAQTGPFFGEGSDFFPSRDGGKKLFQLTWTNGKIFQYDLEATRLERVIPMDKGIPAGWAMTSDWDTPNIAYIDTGDDFIYVADSKQDFKLIGKVRITEPLSDADDTRVGIKAVNEIEYVDGSLYMNRWFSNDIYKVDPKSGYVLNKIDFSALHERSLTLHKKKLGRGFDGDDVFNGIAYDRDRKTWFLTGKNWQKIFEVRMEQEMQFAKP